MKEYHILGLMSGTSLDGLDLASCRIWKAEGQWEFEIVETKNISYKVELREKLKTSIQLPAEELLMLHNSYGTWLGKHARIFIEERNLKTDFIASHGHTTHHQPQNGLTFQIGSGQHLANASGYTTICDFRTNDVALGGEGAPLVPIGDQLFFGDYDFCLNLGGISNVSFKFEDKRVAYDIGLANMILNHLTQKINLAYDEGGQIARKGSVNNEVLQQLNNLEYYDLPFPKSTGYEWFINQVAPIVDGSSDSIENLLHTAVQHICEQVAIQLKANSSKTENSLFITGGGALNDFIIETLEEKLNPLVKVHIPSKTLIEFKEALVFALMGALRMEKEINVLSSVTGAEKDSSSGVIYMPS